MYGTKITDSSPPFLYHFAFLLSISFLRSTLFQSLGRCNSLSPCLSFSKSVSYAFNAEFTTSYLNVLSYPDYCILLTASFMCLFLARSVNSLLQCIIILRISWLNVVLFILMGIAEFAFTTAFVLTSLV